jgi:trans-aconitate methyltransferase
VNKGPAYYYSWSTAYEHHLSVPPFSTWLARNRRSVDRVLPTRPPGAVLEIGGGVGGLGRSLAARYPTARVLSIDSSAVMTARAQAKDNPPNLEFVTRSFWDMEGAFELVVCAGCWEFFPREPSVLRALSLLSPGGTLVLNTLAPAPFSLPRREIFRAVFRSDMWLHRPEQLARDFQDSGCEVSWRRVNATEGSYTLVARAPLRAAARPPRR